MTGRRKDSPLRNPFLEIAGDTYLIVEWYEIDDGEHDRKTMTLMRLTARELRMLDQYRNTSECVAVVLPLVRKRLGFQHPHLHDQERG